ncbi:MAG: sensor histidine kinase, partial [bacterium]
EHVNQIFEPFYRAPGQDEKSGVGLGLAIVREIVQAHGGTVCAQSEIGEVMRISFTLPLPADNQQNVSHTRDEE